MFADGPYATKFDQNFNGKWEGMSSEEASTTVLLVAVTCKQLWHGSLQTGQGPSTYITWQSFFHSSTDPPGTYFLLLTTIFLHAKFPKHLFYITAKCSSLRFICKSNFWKLSDQKLQTADLQTETQPSLDLTCFQVLLAVGYSLSRVPNKRT